MSRYMLSILATLTLVLVCVAPCTAASILIGVPGGGNSFPFGTGHAAGGVYQQVYAAGSFSSAVSIVGITFFNSAGSGATFAAGTYDFSLSTTSRLVDALDTTDFDSNLGPDNQAFASVALSGTVGSGFTISGTPFFYDPLAGNLLLDIRVPFGTSAGTASLDATSSVEGGLFSRAHNYGSGFEGYGLTTQFETADTAIPEPSTAALIGAGLLFLVLRRRK